MRTLGSLVHGTVTFYAFLGAETLAAVRSLQVASTAAVEAGATEPAPASPLR